jgi:hypothetical protein
MNDALMEKVEAGAKMLLADMRLLAEIAKGLTDAEHEAVSDRLQSELDATEDALKTLFPGQF